MKRFIFSTFFTILFFVIFYVCSSYYVSNFIIDHYEKTFDKNFKTLSHEYDKNIFSVTAKSTFEYKNSTIKMTSIIPNSIIGFLSSFDVKSDFEILSGNFTDIFNDSKFANATFIIKDGILQNGKIEINNINFSNNKVTFYLKPLNLEINFKDSFIDLFKVTSNDVMFRLNNNNFALHYDSLVYESKFKKPVDIYNLSNFSSFDIVIKTINLSTKFDKIYSLSIKNLNQNMTTYEDSSFKTRHIVNLDGINLKPKNKFINVKNLAFDVELTAQNKKFYQDFLTFIKEKSINTTPINLIEEFINQTSNIDINSLNFIDQEGRNLNLKSNMRLDKNISTFNVLNYLYLKGDLQFDKRYLDLFIYDAITKKALIDSGILMEKNNHFKVKFKYDKDKKDIFLNDNISVGTLFWGEKFDGFTTFKTF